MPFAVTTPTTADQAAAAKKYNFLYFGSIFMMIAAVCNWIGVYWLFSMAQEVRCADQCFSDNSRQQLLSDYYWGYYPGYYPYYSGWVQTHEDEMGFGTSFMDLHNRRRLEGSLVQVTVEMDETTATQGDTADAPEAVVADDFYKATKPVADSNNVTKPEDTTAEPEAVRSGTEGAEEVVVSPEALGTEVDPADMTVGPAHSSTIHGHNCTNTTIPTADGMPSVTVCIPNDPVANSWWGQYLCDNGINGTANPSIQARQQQQVATLRASYSNDYWCYGRLFSDTDDWSHDGKRGWQGGLFAAGVFAVLTSFFATFMCFLSCAYYQSKPREVTMKRITYGGIIGFITAICTMFSFTPILNSRYHVEMWWFVGWGICAFCWLVFIACIQVFRKALPDLPAYHPQVRRVVAVPQAGPEEAQPLVFNP